ncbi:MAG: LamG domain-containing protein [Anaerolinea sp.]|nr:LamG domain-containing protein [Anaerolinea sp.]
MSTRGHHGLLLGPSGGAVDPHWANVYSLLHFNGSDGSTTFTDVTGKSWADNGNAQIDTAQYLFGGASGLFDGNGDYIYASTGLQSVGDGEDFTLEFAVRLATLTGWQILAAAGKHSGIPAILINFNHSGAPGSIQASLNGNQKSGSIELIANQWHHIAIVRASGLTYIFVDGVMDGAGGGTTTGALDLTTNGAYIGACPPYGGPTLALNGWMDEFRFTKGVARYVANYTPAAAEFPNS